jgi:hypothetical protein
MLVPTLTVGLADESRWITILQTHSWSAAFDGLPSGEE